LPLLNTLKLDINHHIDSPLNLKVSFNRLLQRYEELARSNNPAEVENARRVLAIAEANPVLRDGFSDLSLLKTYEAEIQGILRDTFDPLLTLNEIKTASIPFHNVIFNSSKRFKNIIEAAGEDFELEIKNMPSDRMYIIAASVILMRVYGYNFNFKRPFFYEIPDANGIKRYYKLLYNADFIDIVPRKNAPKLTDQDIEVLLDNSDDLELWKEKFPPNSYDFEGFVISNIFDVTDDQSISNIKSSLIDISKPNDEIMEDLQKAFSSLMGVKDIKVGFSMYNEETKSFEKIKGEGVESFVLKGKEATGCTTAFCDHSFKTIHESREFFSVSDVDLFYQMTKGKAPQYQILKEQGIKSAVFAPIANQHELLGILELVSEQPRALNSLNANKLIDIMPFILMAVERIKREEENLIEAVIQQECTSIHSSVHWRFAEEAKRFIYNETETGAKSMFRSISFDNVYPLFGQIDVKGSSEARNNATRRDLNLQLSLARDIVAKALDYIALPVYEQIKFQIEQYVHTLEHNFKVDSEHEISTCLREEANPVFRLIGRNVKDLQDRIEDYFNRVDTDLEVIYFYRRHYDETIRMINNNMAAMLDAKQEEAQAMYPHFFERFKTDGVEHNMYIGESITKEDSFSPIYLYNLRLWQLQVMVEMENEYYQTQNEYPVALDVASMVLVFNQPLSIRFRQDEKRFDVDGTYNARYEVVKKRVDKAFIKGTTKRATIKGKLTIIYSQKEDENEYLRYIKFMQSKGMLGNDLEYLELEDLQGVTGLKALRVSILYHKDKQDETLYTYQDLMDTIKQA
jgi:hypothetical protein